MEDEKQMTRIDNPIFFKLWDLKCTKRWKEEESHLKDWYSYEIYAKTTRELTMSVWNGSHNPSVEANYKKHVCESGTRVRVWMVSRFGDVGVTDNLINPKGYDIRGLDADKDLAEYEFIEIENK